MEGWMLYSAKAALSELERIIVRILAEYLRVFCLSSWRLEEEYKDFPPRK